MIILDKTHTDNENVKIQVMEAVARGWCHDKNKNKEMDSELALAITDEIMEIME